MERDETQDDQTQEQGTGGDATTPEEDPTQNPQPPGNPQTDDEAVEQGEDQLGRITGR